MKSTCTFGAFLILCLLPLAFSADSCADVVCTADNDACCEDAQLGPTCYNSGFASCPLGSRGHILCAFQEHGEDFACGWWCYDKYVHSCCNETLYQLGSLENPCIDDDTAAPVPPTDSSSSAPSTCANFACPLGTDACCEDARLGPVCYNSSMYSCPTGSKGTILCGFQENGEDFACGLVCYDRVIYSCCNDTLYSRGESPCDTPTAAPATSCATMECPPGMDMCCDDVMLGPMCYNSGIASCPIGSKGPVLCGFQEHGEDFACGFWCYDAVEYECCNDELYQIGDSPCSSDSNSDSDSDSKSDSDTATTSPATPAPVNPTASTIASCASIVCRDDTDACCDDVRLGPVCYNSEIASCPTGSVGPVLCSGQERGACGTSCYDMDEYACCNDILYGISNMNNPCNNATETNNSDSDLVVSSATRFTASIMMILVGVLAVMV